MFFPLLAAPRVPRLETAVPRSQAKVSDKKKTEHGKYTNYKGRRENLSILNAAIQLYYIGQNCATKPFVVNVTESLLHGGEEDYVHKLNLLLRVHQI